MHRLAFLLRLTLPLLAQSDAGELRLKVTDAAGLPVPCTVELASQANQVRQKMDTDASGTLDLKRLPFGLYRLRVERAGFAPHSGLVEIRSAIPYEYRVTMAVAPIETQVVVRDSETLLDPRRTATVNRIGPETLATRATAQPGRSLLDLVNTEPGWLLEANGVLHPRGSEYQTQYILDGIPLTENRSPAFSPELEAGDVQSMSILTAGYPAEYGRKLGGVIDVVTARDARPGLHARAAASGGSFASASGSLMAQYGWGRNTIVAGAEAGRTDRYLDPPVEQNYSNAGTNSTASARYERDLSERDRLGLVLRRGQSRFQVPNERVQQDAGQRQDRTSAETAGQFSWQHTFSPNVVGDLRGMARDLSATLWSNSLAAPIVAAQDRGLREAYLKAAVSVHRGRHEWKAGAEADLGSVHESFAYRLADAAQFDPGTPPEFRFADHRPDREEAVFVQDLMRLGNWTVSAGLRFDHYALVVDENAASPRLGVAWYWPAAGLVLRGSIDRIFQTPAVENLLLASSRSLAALNENVLRLPVRPSRGNFYEAGLAKALFGKLRLDATCFRRAVRDFADDDLLLNTGVSFPIAFRRAEIHGVEAKVEVPRWGPLSGFLSYSNMLGTGLLPVTGGLFLGDDATNLLHSAGRFPITQDQRNTARARLRGEITPRVWAAVGGDYGSGLPVAFGGSVEEALALYGRRIVGRVNFDRGRVRPSFSLDASVGIVVRRNEKRSVRLQGDLRNITNRLNVLDFAGLFSGTAVGAPRSAAGRIEVEF
jgi:outer membrane cobalamin receptor